MGSEATDDFPPLKPIRTTPTTDADYEGCVTPKSEEHVLRTPVACPPPPRKPRPAKRKGMGPTGLKNWSFCAVPRDLTLVFLALPTSSRRSEKRIRVS